MHRIKVSGIYKITHLSGYYYIGMSVDIFGRWSSHYTDIIMNRHSSPEFKDLMLSTNLNEWKFEVLEYVSKTELKKQSKLKGKQFDNYLRKHLLFLEWQWMYKHGVDLALNKDKKRFKTSKN